MNNDGKKQNTDPGSKNPNADKSTNFEKGQRSEVNESILPDFEFTPPPPPPATTENTQGSTNSEPQ